MNLWLDDIREPWKFGHIGWTWAKTADEAIEYLKTGTVEECSLDHDLSELATIGMAPESEKTGYTVVCWMEENNIWPTIINIHSMNPSGSMKMYLACKRAQQRSREVLMDKPHVNGPDFVFKNIAKKDV